MKTLVIAPSWVGDMMMSHSLYRTLHNLHPAMRIDVMAPAWCRPLLERMPEVAETLEMPLGHGKLALGERYHLGLSLRGQDYHQAYILPNSFKSALIPWFARIPERIGWRGEMRYGLLNDLRVLDKAAFPRMVERYVALAYTRDQIRDASQLPPLLWPQLQVEENEIAEMVTRFHLVSPRPLVGFCPGAEFGPAKRWPHYHYATLAQKLIAQGKQIVLFGSQSDKMAGETIRQALTTTERSYCINLAGETTLDQVVVLLAVCHAVVSNDSGLMHIAAALQRPLVALYGPSSTDFTPPLTKKVVILRLISGYHKVRRGSGDEGYHQSLIDIQPQQVEEALRQLLAKECGI